MSDFNEIPGVPPPPAGAAPSPFAAPAPPPPPSYSMPPYGVSGYPVMASGSKPPRPAVTVGAALLVGGAALMILGSFLTWFTILGTSYNGFSGGDDGGSKDGPIFLVLGLLLLGFGIAQLAARKVLAIGIVAIIVAVSGLFAVLFDLSDVSDSVDIADSIGIDASSGPGLWIILIGSMIALAGAIATVAKRRA